jgi:hypothetical protein
MTRIQTCDEPETITVMVDGQFSRDYVDAVSNCIDQAGNRGKPVRLFLRNVSHIDEKGRELLSRLAARGIELSASGLYSSYVVAEIHRPPKIAS